MKNNKYRLQSVLDVRDRAKQTAAHYVAACRAKLAEAEAELTRRKQSVLDCRNQQTQAYVKMMEQVLRGTDAYHLVVHRTHASDLRHTESELTAKVREQQTTVSRAESELEKAILGFVEASKEVQVIEKHRESWREQSRRDERRREQKINDEVGASIHQRPSFD